jgi:dienelactone hydrolase
VGRRLLHWVDSARREPTDSTHARELMVWMWYPAAAGNAGHEAALPGAWGEAHAREGAPKIGAEAAAALRELRVHAHTDARPLVDSGPLPVLLFFPGLGWLPSDYSTLAEDLASHGYVVFGVAPTGLAGLVQLPDGRQVPRLLGTGPRIGTDQAHAHDDARFAMAQLRRLDAGVATGLAGRLDLARIGAFGHSLGGTTSLVLAASDTAIRAAVNIDGDPMGVVRDVRPRQPILLVSSESPPVEEFPHPADSQQLALVRAGLERSERRRTGEWEQIAREAERARRIVVPGARHSDFLDVALVEARITDPTLRWMRVGPAGGERVLRTTREVIRSFFDRELRGAPEARLPQAR